jgi:hypothetical protein
MRECGCQNSQDIDSSKRGGSGSTRLKEEWCYVAQGRIRMASGQKGGLWKGGISQAGDDRKEEGTWREGGIS